MSFQHSSKATDDNTPEYKKICNSFGCDKKAIREIKVKAGEQTISLYVCNDCLEKFQ